LTEKLSLDLRLLKLMPELPEVETVRRQLHNRIAGKTIREVVIYKTGREQPVGKRFVQKVVGRRLLGVKRRAKILIFELDDGLAILGHLKMTGKFVFLNPTTYNLKPTPSKHDRILFVFDSKTHLIWNDVRMFGYLKVVTHDEAQEALLKYGPEPLESTAEELAKRLHKKSTRSIKATLLDQTVIAGVGNIYADESLFRAGIRPTRKTNKLTGDERLKLAQEIKNVLSESLSQKGTSANDYVDTEGEKGGFLEFLRVYGRTGKPCRKCKSPIKKMFVAQRGTHYCTRCQA
jgi:formamidopyrimidine-DNA glycosylase